METEKKISVALEILNQARNTLCRELPPFIRAVNAIVFEPSQSNLTYINGNSFFFSADEICQKYKTDKNSISRLLLHSVLHCMLLHPWNTSFKDRKLWDLACDISVENIINSLDAACSRNEKSDVEQRAISELLKSVKSLTAENIYYYFTDKSADKNFIKSFSDLFLEDSHGEWYKGVLYSSDEEDELTEIEARSIYKRQDDRQGQYHENGKTLTDTSNSEGNNTKDEWKETANQIIRDFELFPAQFGFSDGDGLQALKAVTHEKFDYSDLLKRFLQDDEALEINDDEFDYIYYTYGLRLYENIPLIEPLEYAENNKIGRLVIAIDTSGSVKGDIVEGFVRKTYSILKSTDFFRKDCEIHIVQCDSQIKDIAIIKNGQELEDYINNLTLHGFGGTDFTPVFEYADNMFNNLTNKKHFNGIIYFTDGDGLYPEKAPPYKNAFVIHDNGFDKSRLPLWATPLYMDKNELRER